MVVECAFGRLKGRWRVLLKRSDTQFPKTVQIITTCVILHNICENANELYRQEWNERVQDFDLLFPKPEEGDYRWDNTSGEDKRYDLVQTLNENAI
jgi:DDE superfamily endonuclease